MKKFALAVGLISLAGITLAHEFWLQPSQYFARVGDRISVQVMVGEGFVGERSEGKKNRLVQYRHYTTTGSTDLSPALTGDYLRRRSHRARNTRYAPVRFRQYAKIPNDASRQFFTLPRRRRVR